MKNIENISRVYTGVAVFLLSTIIALWAMDLLSSATVHVIKKVTGDDVKLEERLSQLPLYKDKDYAEQYWKDHRKSYYGWNEMDYFYWKGLEYKSKYINVSADGWRETTKQPNEGAKRVFMFGGSTMWGWGAPDSMTIASYLQSFLGPDYDVYNFGQSGYVSTQELNVLLFELANENIPDIVIFYDGLNDTSSGLFAPGVPRAVASTTFDKSRKKKRRSLPEFLYYGSHTERLVKQIHKIKKDRKDKSEPTLWELQVEPMIPQNAEKTVYYWEKNIEVVKALGERYGFDSYFYWQPCLIPSARKPLPYEQTIIDETSRVWVKSFEAAWAEARKRLKNRENEHIFYIGDIFLDVKEPIYMQIDHIGPEGNKIVAQEIYETMIRSIAGKKAPL